MISEGPSIIKIFSKFLDPKVSNIKKLKKIEDILELPIYAYNFLNDEDVKILQEVFEVYNIKDVSKLNKEGLFDSLFDHEKADESQKNSAIREDLNVKIEELKEKFPSLEDKLKKAITISSIVISAKDESEFLEKKEQKVAVVGLDNAGKTAILTKLGGRLGINDLALIKPTKGVERRHIKTDVLDLYIWDFGGQISFRDRYLENPEKYFLQLDLLMFVIDIQDSERFEDFFDYFEKILDIIIALEEDPYLLVFIHKYDPDIKSKPEILLNVEFLKENLREVFENKNYEFDYEIYLTSIFSLISKEPKFSKYIKNVMKAYSLTNPTYKKVEGLGNLLEETMNSVIRLSESISLQLSAIEHRLAALESNAFLAAQSGVPMEIQEQNVIKDEESTRTLVLDELKDLFSKKRGVDL
ncbi:MAG: ADP-ribosylation factor-like protein [Promethearchaeota archaeon]